MSIQNFPPAAGSYAPARAALQFERAPAHPYRGRGVRAEDKHYFRDGGHRDASANVSFAPRPTHGYGAGHSVSRPPTMPGSRDAGSRSASVTFQRTIETQTFRLRSHDVVERRAPTSGPHPPNPPAHSPRDVPGPPGDTRSHRGARADHRGHDLPDGQHKNTKNGEDNNFIDGADENLVLAFLRDRKREESRRLDAIEAAGITSYEAAEATDDRYHYSRSRYDLARAREDREVSLACLRDLDEEIEEAKGRLRRQLAAPTARPINHSAAGAINTSEAGANKNSDAGANNKNSVTGAAIIPSRNSRGRDPGPANLGPSSRGHATSTGASYSPTPSTTKGGASTTSSATASTRTPLPANPRTPAPPSLTKGGASSPPSAAPSTRTPVPETSRPPRDPGPANLGPSTGTPMPATSCLAAPPSIPPPLPRPASPTETVDQYFSVLSSALDAEVREIDTLTGSDGDFYEDEESPFDEDDDGSFDEDGDGSFTSLDNTTIDRGGFRYNFHAALLKIQSTFRGASVRRGHLRRRCAATTIRAWLRRRLVHCRLRHRRATNTIRDWLCRQMVHRRLRRHWASLRRSYLDKVRDLVLAIYHPPAPPQRPPPTLAGPKTYRDAVASPAGSVASHSRSRPHRRHHRRGRHPPFPPATNLGGWGDSLIAHHPTRTLSQKRTTRSVNVASGFYPHAAGRRRRKYGAQNRAQSVDALERGLPEGV